MTALTWDAVGERYYELGVDRGVFYQTNGVGVAWNGLVSVTESPSGGEATAYYADGVKYLNLASRKEFEGKIDAYTYPDEFLEYDGWIDLGNGLVIDEQRRKPFGMSYRTLIGNDVDGMEHGYKLHIVYNVLVKPPEVEYATLDEDVEPIAFSWDFTTTPGKPDPTLMLAPYAHYVIDSRKTNPTQMRFIEGFLYGTESRAPTLPTLEQMYILFENPMVTLIVQPNTATGIATLVESDTVRGDLRGRISGPGWYVAADYSRLFESNIAGIYTLER